MSFIFNWDIFQTGLSKRFQSVISDSSINHLSERPKPIISDIKVSDLKINKSNLQLSLTKLLDINDENFIAEFRLNYDYNNSHEILDFLTLQFDIELNKFCLSQQLRYRLKNDICLTNENSPQVFNIRKDVGYEFAEPNFLLAGKSSIVPIKLNLTNFVIASDLIIRCALNEEKDKTSFQILNNPEVKFEFLKDDHYKLLDDNYTDILKFFETKLIPIFLNSLQEFITPGEIDELMKESLGNQKVTENSLENEDITESNDMDIDKLQDSIRVEDNNTTNETSVITKNNTDTQIQINSFQLTSPFFSEDEGHNTTDSSIISVTPSSNSSHSVIEEFTIGMNTATIDEDDEKEECIDGDGESTRILGQSGGTSHAGSNTVSPKKRTPRRRTISFKELKNKFSPFTTDKVNPRADFSIESIGNTDLPDIAPDFVEHSSHLDLDQSDEEIEMNDEGQTAVLDSYTYSFENNRVVSTPIPKKKSFSSYSNTSNSTLNRRPASATGSVMSSDFDRSLEYAFMKNSSIPEYIKENKKFKFIKIGKVQKFVHMFEHQQPDLSPTKSTSSINILESPVNRSRSRLTSSEYDSPVKRV